jgi:hypothetical protein
MRTLGGAMLVGACVVAEAQDPASLADVQITDAEIAALARGLGAERQALERGRARLAKDRAAHEAAVRKQREQEKKFEAYQAAVMKYADCLMGDGKAIKEGFELMGSALKALDDPELQQVIAAVMAIPPAERAAWTKRDSLRKRRAEAARNAGDVARAKVLEDESRREFEKMTGVSAVHMDKLSAGLGLDGAKAARVEANLAATQAKCGGAPAEVEPPEDVPDPEQQMLEQVRSAGAAAARMAESDYGELLGRLGHVGDQPLAGRFQALAPYRAELNSSRERGWPF